ncbi:MAG: serine/threonine protein kinase [Proteobacteria bacterium]|jgi:serine/threonine-protein kinase|nr:serine/threonine protein kinase [Pseudomonadota bacterium]
MSSDLIGKVLDRKYRIVRVIGVGGMGTVYEAEHIVISRRVALKILAPEFVSRPETVERFFREAKAASAIGHPNIIDIYDVGREEDDTVYIVMELLKGISLADCIDCEKRLEPTAAAAVAAQVLSALRAAHEKGIVHRDLKSDNVFLAVDSRDRQEVKLLDFGIAKVGTTGTHGLGLTRDGDVVGTPYYLSPEQARGARDVDARIDIWGVGVILYEMLTGSLPYTGENYNEVLGKILLEAPKPILELVPELPAELVAIVEKAMQKDRDLRYGSAAAMLEDLTPFIESSSTESMSTVVFKTMKGIPVTPMPGSRMLLFSTPGSGVRRRSDPLAHTSDIPEEERAILDGMSRKRRKRMLVPLALVVVFGVLVAGVTLALFAGGSDGAEAKPAGAVANGWNAADAAAPAIEESVTIELRGLPAGARVLVDGEPATPPVSHPKTSAAGHFEISAEGYVTLDLVVVFDKNQAIDVALKALEVEKAGEAVQADSAPKPEEKKSGGKSGKKKGKKGGWESNPFD